MANFLLGLSAAADWFTTVAYYAAFGIVIGGIILAVAAGLVAMSDTRLPLDEEPAKYGPDIDKVRNQMRTELTAGIDRDEVA